MIHLKVATCQPPLCWRNATFVLKKCIIRRSVFIIFSLWLMKFTCVGAHFGLHSFASSIQYWLALSHVFRSGAADAEQNLKKAIALKDIHTLEVAPCRSRGWLNRYKAPKQTVQVNFFFSETHEYRNGLAFVPSSLQLNMLPSVRSIPYKKHWRIRMIFLITFSRNHFVKTVWSMRRLDRFAKGYVWTCSICCWIVDYVEGSFLAI